MVEVRPSRGHWKQREGTWLHFLTCALVFLLTATLCVFLLFFQAHVWGVPKKKTCSASSPTFLRASPKVPPEHNKQCSGKKATVFREKDVVQAPCDHDHERCKLMSRRKTGLPLFRFFSEERGPPQSRSSRFLRKKMDVFIFPFRPCEGRLSRGHKSTHFLNRF